jgi:hypothetical protein
LSNVGAAGCALAGCAFVFWSLAHVCYVGC